MACDTKTPSAARAPAPQSSRVKTRQEVVGVERVPPPNFPPVGYRGVPGVPGGTPPSPGFELPAAAAEAGTSDEEEEFHQQVSFSTVADENRR